MPKIYYYIIVCFFILSTAYSQNTITLKGKVVNTASKMTLESATVYLSISKDSTLIDYTITDKNGFFDLKVKKTQSPTFLKIAIQGFEDYKQSLLSIDSDVNFNTIEMIEASRMLGEIAIKSEAPPVRIKKDTLEFNVASFKVRPDANVETLLKQLPGVEVGTDGKITVNGKEVNQILVNGKPFFDKDGKIALQSLPSDLIKKVQVSDTKTKAEKLSGKASSSNNASINFTIDKDKEKGLFGKFTGGYGSNKRYESSVLVNYFKNKRKISVLASSNNINATGFSMDEIFDNMGGGRNVNYYYSDNGSFGIGSARFGGNNGITLSNMVGLNYRDEWSKYLETNGSYFYSDANSKNTSASKQVNFLPTGQFTTVSNAISSQDRFSHNSNFEFEFKIDSTTTISISPSLNKSNSKYFSNSFQSSLNENNQLLNESKSDNYENTDVFKFENRIDFFKSFRRKGRSINASLENSNSKDKKEAINISETLFYQSTDPDDTRNQWINNSNKESEYTASINYNEKIADSLSIRLGLTQKFKQNISKTDAFDFNTILQSYSNANPFLTNSLVSYLKTTTPSAGFWIEKSKLSLNIDLGTAITHFDNASLYLNNQVSLNKEFIYPYANAYMNLKLGKSKSMWLNYNYNVDFPSPEEFLPVENLSNPLNTFIGNPNLNPNKQHDFYVSFRNFKYATKSGFSIYINGNFYESQVVSVATFDTNRKRRTTYENVNNTYSSWIGGNWNKTIKNEAHTFKLGVGVNINLGLSKGITNNQLYDAKSMRITPRINFTYEYGELLTINPTYNVSFNNTRYTNYLVDEASNVIHKFNIQTTNYWPKNWVFGNDFGYTYNSNIADGFKKDFYLWNSSLSYSFFDKKFSAKVKVYDVLNQNQSATRSISATTIRDEENVVLQQYVMFSLTYKMERFAGKEKKASSGRMFFY